MLASDSLAGVVVESLGAALEPWEWAVDNFKVWEPNSSLKFLRNDLVG